MTKTCKNYNLQKLDFTKIGLCSFLLLHAHQQSSQTENKNLSDFLRFSRISQDFLEISRIFQDFSLATLLSSLPPLSIPFPSVSISSPLYSVFPNVSHVFEMLFKKSFYQYFQCLLPHQKIMIGRLIKKKKCRNYEWWGKTPVSI